MCCPGPLCSTSHDIYPVYLIFVPCMQPEDKEYSCPVYTTSKSIHHMQMISPKVITWILRCSTYTVMTGYTFWLSFLMLYGVIYILHNVMWIDFWSLDLSYISTVCCVRYMYIIFCWHLMHCGQEILYFSVIIGWLVGNHMDCYLVSAKSLPQPVMTKCESKLFIHFFPV